MKFKDILEDVKIDSEEYLNEAVIKKGKKYYVVKNHNKKDFIPGTKEAGYASLENAVKAMMDQTNSSFKALPFDQKREKVSKYVKTWKTKNGITDPKPRKKYGFEQITFSEDE